MNTYTLSARLLGKTAQESFTAEDDNDATVTAVFRILENASKRNANGDRWARGRIELLNNNTNTIIKTMEAKQ